MSRWQTNCTVRFVREYIKHEQLWNVKHSGYKNSHARQLAYASLERSMNIAGFNLEAVKMKIRSIRGTYLQEVRKIKEQQNTPHPYVPAIKWFQMLDDALNNIKSASPIKINASSDEDGYSTLHPTNAKYLPDIPKTDETVNEAIVQLYDNDDDSEHNSSTIDSNNYLINLPKRHKTEELIIGRRAEDMPTVSKWTEKRDSSDIYGEHIAAKHRKYSEYVKCIVEHSIADILFEADMGKYDLPDKHRSLLRTEKVFFQNDYDDPLDSSDE